MVVADQWSDRDLEANVAAIANDTNWGLVFLAASGSNILLLFIIVPAVLLAGCGLIVMTTFVASLRSERPAEQSLFWGLLIFMGAVASTSGLLIRLIFDLQPYTTAALQSFIVPSICLLGALCALAAEVARRPRETGPPTVITGAAQQGVAADGPGGYAPGDRS